MINICLCPSPPPQVTNPTTRYIAKQNFVVQTSDCIQKWAWPVALEAGKSAHYTVPLKLDKCSNQTLVVLQSGIEGTLTTGPDVFVRVTPAPHNGGSLCAKRVT